MRNLMKTRLQEIFTRCTQCHIGVIGDIALDAYWYADMTRAFLSRETPLFPRPVVREAYSPGAGANVADNLAALGVGHVTVFSVIGDDWRGKLLRQVLAERGIDGSQLITAPQRNTTTFVKPILLGYDSQQEDARIDFENDQPLSLEAEDALLDTLSNALPTLDALLIADQLEINGIITDRVREKLNALAAAHPHTAFLVDSRVRIGQYENIILKPNRFEASAALGVEHVPELDNIEELASIAKTLEQRTQHPVFLTLSEAGVLVCADGETQHIPAGPTKPPLDPVGAGDTFIAALGAALASGATPQQAGTLATLAAAVTVEKLNQTGTASPDEIFAKYDLATQNSATIG